MKEIKLTQGEVALVDDDLYEELNLFKWCVHKGVNTFYAKRDQKGIMMHRVVVGLTDLDLFVDHINGNGLDNQKSNLRICSQSKNSMNQSPQLNRSSIYKGVCYHKLAKKWQSYIKINGKLKYNGLFVNESDAAIAYNNMAAELFGKYAKLNVIKY